MGLASSQARLLTLTARQHSVEYAAQRLEAQKLQLANESDQVYNNYLQKLDATKVQYKVVGGDGAVRFENATFSKLHEAGFLFNVAGTICKTWAEVQAALSGEPYKVDVTVGDSYTLLSTLVAEGYVVLMQQKEDSERGYEYDQANGKIVYKDPSTGVENASMGCAITMSMSKEDKEKLYKVFGDTSVSTSTKVQEIADEVDLRKAEAEYEADMNRINAKDARYDTELAQLETERNAIKQEIDTLNTVAKENVERTFKIFS